MDNLMIPFSIIVVCYNLWHELTLPFIQTFWEYVDKDIEFELWIVDNGSQDETQEQSRVIIPGMSSRNCVGINWYFWDSSGQTGIMPKVRNHIYPMCKGKNIVLFNNDILFHKTGWLRILNDVVDESVGMAGQDLMRQYCIPFIGGGWDCIPKKMHDEIVANRDWFSDVEFGLSCDDVDLSGMVCKLGYNIRQISKLKSVYIEHHCHKTMDAFIPIEEQITRMDADKALIKKRCKEGYYENTTTRSSLR